VKYPEENVMKTKFYSKAIATFFFALFIVFIPLIVSGDIHWIEAWALAVLVLVVTIASRILAIRKNPDILQERASFMDAEGIKSWDKKIVPLLAFVVPAIIYVVFGLDHRFSWSLPVSTFMKVAGFIALIFGYLLSTWAMVANRFFSSVVRIQKERGHVVCDTGPYQWVRHPGYLGGLISWVGIPLFVGSLWGYLPVLLIIILYILRTQLEDQTLQAELPGYQEFARQTRYRLLPGVW
jgi:protein-S-isoprenylcysteine O-methyltransferase Ste14